MCSKKYISIFFCLANAYLLLFAEENISGRRREKKVKDTQHYQPVLQPTSNHYNCITQEHIYPWLTHISFHCKFLKCVCVSMIVFYNVIL